MKVLPLSGPDPVPLDGSTSRWSVLPWTATSAGAERVFADVDRDRQYQNLAASVYGDVRGWTWTAWSMPLARRGGGRVSAGVARTQGAAMAAADRWLIVAGVDVPDPSLT